MIFAVAAQPLWKARTLRHIDIDELEPATQLDAWYSSGDLTEAQYQALKAWRDDGGGVRLGERAMPEGRRESNSDIMADAARDRHRRGKRVLLACRDGDRVARACHRLCMIDDGAQDIDLVQRGASALWAEYFGWPADPSFRRAFQSA